MQIKKNIYFTNNMERFYFRIWSIKDRRFINNNDNYGFIFSNVMIEIFDDQFVNENGSIGKWIVCDENYIVEQCTGQKAGFSNAFIFENDIVDSYNQLTDSWERCIVKWDKDTAGFLLLYVNPQSIKRGCGFASSSGTYFDSSSCKIVGNVHEEILNR